MEMSFVTRPLKNMRAICYKATQKHENNLLQGHSKTWESICYKATQKKNESNLLQGHSKTWEQFVTRPLKNMRAICYKATQKHESQFVTRPLKNMRAICYKATQKHESQFVTSVTPFLPFVRNRETKILMFFAARTNKEAFTKKSFP